jgi:hypothetical protein
MVSAQTQRNTAQTNLSQAEGERQPKVLKAIVIVPNEKTTDLGSLLAIARSEACRREHIQENPIIRAMVFAPELGVYVAIYESKTRDLPKENCGKQGVS